MSRAPDTWILTADCPSVLGTVDAVTRFLFEQGCYVTEHHSFDDRLSGRFFIRVEFRQPDGFDEQSFRAGLAEAGVELFARAEGNFDYRTAQSAACSAGRSRSTSAANQSSAARSSYPKCRSLT